jgi:predicted ATPase
MKFVFNCRNYRGLQFAHFAPDGVCLLVGANGFGKTTLLDALSLVRNLYLRPTRSAIELDGGRWGLRNFSAESWNTIDFRIDLGTHNWFTQLRTVGPEEEYSFHEHLSLATDPAGQELLDSMAVTGTTGGLSFKFRGAQFVRSDGSALKLAWELTHDDDLEALVKFLGSIRTYRHYRMSQLREHGCRVDSDLYLRTHGDNLFTVLRNWRDRRETRGSFDFVLESLRAAFPEFFDDLDFYGDSQTVGIRVYLRGVPEPMPLKFVPDGLLVAMLHLAAVAGSPGQSFVAIDDFENYLHPFAIRSLIESLRARSIQRDLCVLLATHSPVALDEFRTEPSRVFVMNPSTPQTNPLRLNEIFDSEWLGQFSFGDLYSQLEFGARLPGHPHAPEVTSVEVAP